MIELNDLRKAFGANEVLRGLKASFLPGKVYGIVGPNGAGKTTLFRCISGRYDFDGKIVAPEDQLRLRLGYLPTQNYFMDFMTGREYLRLMIQGRSLPVPDLNARNIFQLPLDEYVSGYSTGMQKKLALLGVLLQQNEIFILDEPYNGVDIQSNLLITEIIRELKRKGKTVLLSSHIFATLADTCDEVLLLDQGVFSRHVHQDGFTALEAELREATVAGLVERLKL